MEYVIEFILELALESGIYASKNTKLPKYIRYPLIILISLFFIFVIGVVFFTGILLLKDKLYLGIFILIIGVFMLVSVIIKFKKIYLIKK